MLGEEERKMAGDSLAMERILFSAVFPMFPMIVFVFPMSGDNRSHEVVVRLEYFCKIFLHIYVGRSPSELNFYLLQNFCM